MRLAMRMARGVSVHREEQKITNRDLWRKGIGEKRRCQLRRLRSCHQCYRLRV